MSILWMNHGWSSDNTYLKDPTKLLVWLALADFANDEGVSWPLVSTIAAKARTSERNVSRILSGFVGNGMLMRKFRYKESTLYLLQPPDAWGANLSGQDQDTPEIEAFSPTSGVTDETSGVTPVADRTVITNNHQELPNLSSQEVVAPIEASTREADSPVLLRTHPWYPHPDALRQASASERYMTPDDYIDYYLIRCREIDKKPSSGEWLKWFIQDDAASRIKERNDGRRHEPLTDDLGVPTSWSRKI